MTNHILQSTETILVVLAVIGGAAFALTRIRLEQRYDNDESLWDLSTWDMNNIEDMQRTAIAMHELRINLKPSGSASPVHLTASTWELKNVMIEDGIKRREKTGGGGIARRLRIKKYSQQARRWGQQENHLKKQENKWDEEAEDMEGEIIQYFHKEKGRAQQKKEQVIVRGAKRSNMKTNKNEVQRRKSNIDHQDGLSLGIHRRDQQYTWEDPFSLSCTDPNADTMPCPPEELPQKCDKYNGGTMEECYQLCKISFCCIHDSLSVELAPSCSQELNCKNWSPCYIVWWKLHDTIGPLNFVRLEQDEPFYNINFQYILNDTNIGDGEDVSPFYKQLFYHHWDDDAWKPDAFVEDPLNW